MREPKKIVLWRFAFFLTLLIALNARFIGIVSENLSLSELTTLDAALQPLKDLLSQFSFATSQNSPLYNLLLHGWSTLFPKSIFAYRSLAAVLSFTAIFPLFGISRILFNKRISYTAIAFYAVSSLAVGIAQSISPLTLFLQFTVMSTWALLMMVRRHQKRFRAFYIGTILGALFTHPAVWFLIIFHHIVAFGSFFHKDNRHLTWKNWFTIEAILITIIILTFPEQVPAIELPFDRGAATPLIGFLQLLYKLGGSLILLLLSFGLFYQLFFNSRRYHIVFHTFTPRVMFLLLWFLVTSISPFLFSFASGDLGRANGSVAGIFPFFLLLACAIDTFEHKRRRRGLIAFFIFISLWILFDNFRDTNRTDWASAIAVARNSSAEAPILLTSPEDEPLFEYYAGDQLQGLVTTIEMASPEDSTQPSWSEVLKDDSMHLFVTDFSSETNTAVTQIKENYSFAEDTTLTYRGALNQHKKAIRYILLTKREK